jgi:hypothetical protein
MKYFKHTTIQQYNSESHDAAPAVVYDNSQILHDDIVLTAQSNSELFTLMQTAGVVISTHSTYYTKADLGKITQTQFNSIQFSSSNIKTFNEFKYFTSVTTIPMNCFLNSSLSEITLHDNLILIAEYAFKQTNISKIILPDSITTLGMGAFEQCENLCEIKLSSNNNFTSISQSAFNNCQNLRSINITDNITSLNSSVFSSTKLSSINIPQSITVIPANAFAGTKIESLYIPEGVTEIGLNAFKDCTNLKNVIISSTVTTVQSGAFMNCTSLQHITCLATTAPQLTEINAITPFSGINIYGTLVYPESSDYSSWLSFGENFLGYFGWNDTIISTEASNKPFVDWAREQQWIPQNFNYMTSHQAASVTQLQFDNATKFIETNENITGRQSQYIDKIRYLNELRYFTKLTNLSSYGYHNRAYRFPNVVELTVPDTLINTFDYFFTTDGNRLKKLTIPTNFTNFRTIKEGTNPTYYNGDYFFNDCNAEEIVFESETPPDFEIAFLQGFYYNQKNITIRYPYRRNTGYSDIYASLRTYINNNFEQSSTVICNVVEGIYEDPSDLKIYHILEDLSEYSINITTSSLAYNTSQQTVSFTVEKDGSTLIKNIDYTVLNNSDRGINVGTYTLRIQGAGQYSGVLSASWSIVKCNITGKQFTPNGISYIYDGTSYNPVNDGELNSIRLRYDNYTYIYLYKDTDYTLSGTTNAINIGDYTITITGIGNFSGTLNFYWVIDDPIPMEDVSISWQNEPLVYNGSQQEAIFILSYDDEPLSSSDYTITNNQATNAGQYTASFTGQGIYDGTETYTWYISKSPTNISFVTSYNANTGDTGATYVWVSNNSTINGYVTWYVKPYGSSEIYDGGTTGNLIPNNLPQNPSLNDAGMLIELQPGEWEIYAEFHPADTSNYLTCNITQFIEVSSSVIDLSDCQLRRSYDLDYVNHVYDGSPQTPDPGQLVYITYNPYEETILYKDTDYFVSYQNNIEPGTATIIITGMGHYTGTKTVTFRIEKATPDVYFNSYTVTFDFYPHYITATNDSNVSGELEYGHGPSYQSSSSNYVILNSNSTSTNLTGIDMGITNNSVMPVWGRFTPNNTQNYNIVNIYGSVYVQSLVLQSNSPGLTIINDDTYDYYVYDGSPITPSNFTIRYQGRTITDEIDKYTYTNNTRPGTGTVTITSDNGDIRFNIPYTFEIYSDIVDIEIYSNGTNDNPIIYDNENHYFTFYNNSPTTIFVDYIISNTPITPTPTATYQFVEGQYFSPGESGILEMSENSAVGTYYLYAHIVPDDTRFDTTLTISCEMEIYYGQNMAE